MRAIFPAPFTLAALLLVMPADNAHARPLDEVIEAKSLKVILYEDNKPFSWTDGEVAKGIDVDLARALAKELGVNADVVLRMQSERADGDIRANVTRGPLTGGGTGDVMLHLPFDEDFAARFKEAVFINPYFEERVALAIDPKRIPPDSNFQIFKKEKIGVKLATVADYFLMGFEDGALVNNISHYVRDPVGLKEFTDGETAAILGVRSETEGLLHEVGAKATFIEPDMTGIIRKSWAVGMAVNEKSRDLGEALGKALGKLKESGELTKIFANYGVTYVAPPAK